MTYSHDFDYTRLNAQMIRVFNDMKSGRWKTLRGISSRTGDPEASVSARIRDLRKERFGGHTIERQRGESGLWRYRLVPKGE